MKQKIKPCRDLSEACSGRGNSMCSGPGARQHLVDSGNSKEAKCRQSGVSEAEGVGGGGCLGRETMPALAVVMRTWLV